jgi:hypothetical protein
MKNQMVRLTAKTTIAYDNGDGTGSHTAKPGDTFELDEKKYPESYKHLLESGDAEETTRKSGPLPDDFPGRAALETAGIDTYGKLRQAGDVTSVPGIGEATAKKIAAELKD